MNWADYAGTAGFLLLTVGIFIYFMRPMGG